MKSNICLYECTDYHFKSSFFIFVRWFAILLHTGELYYPTFMQSANRGLCSFQLLAILCNISTQALCSTVALHATPNHYNGSVWICFAPVILVQYAHYVKGYWSQTVAQPHFIVIILLGGCARSTRQQSFGVSPLALRAR